MKRGVQLLFVFAALVFFQCESESGPDCSVQATVRDLTGFDGCGIVLELEDGTRLEPLRLIRCGTPPQAKQAEQDPLDGFVFYDGQLVTIGYEETESPSICMVGPVVRITCISEVGTISEE
jgi:hypothetical protein